MKNIFTLALIINAGILFAQYPCDDTYLNINFDDTTCLSRLTVDTILCPNNIWQIGNPQKVSFDNTICPSKVIVTDTAQPYPINDTSIFYINMQVTPGLYYGCKMFSGSYYVQTDSLNDYGMIEFSPDHGATWIDILNDSMYSPSFIWYTKPVLTGHSGTCKYFNALFGDIASLFSLQIGDSIQFRFTFISDSLFDNMGGLMYDNFNFFDFIEGISETRFKPIKSSIYPNPGSGIFTIQFENPASEAYELSVYDINSKPILKQENITDKTIIVNATSYKPGIYIYKLTNMNDNKRCWGKFVVDK